MHAKYADVVKSTAVLSFAAGLTDDLFAALPNSSGAPPSLEAAE
jgi:hypothetical protein